MGKKTIASKSVAPYRILRNGYNFTQRRVINAIFKSTAAVLTDIVLDLYWKWFIFPLQNRGTTCVSLAGVRVAEMQHTICMAVWSSRRTIENARFVAVDCATAAWRRCATKGRTNTNGADRLRSKLLKLLLSPRSPSPPGPTKGAISVAKNAGATRFYSDRARRPSCRRASRAGGGGQSGRCGVPA